MCVCAQKECKELQSVHLLQKTSLTIDQCFREVCMCFSVVWVTKNYVLTMDMGTYLDSSYVNVTGV